MKVYFFKNYVFLVLLFVHAFALNSAATESVLEKVKLQLKWKHQFQFAGYYAAIEKGYYKDVGLNVELIEASETELPADAFINGSADFGISASDVVLMRADGHDVVVLATIFQHSAQILLASKSSGIKHVHNLVGKKLMIEPHSADLVAYMNDEGVSLNQIESVAHSFDVNWLIENRMDAMTAYSTDEPFVLKEQNIDYTIISPNSGGIDFYGDVLITSERFLKSKPNLTKNFREASLKGWKYAMNNTDEIIDVIYNKYSQRHSKEHLAFEAHKMQNLILPDIIEIGYSNVGRWKRIIDIFKQTNMLDVNSTIEGLMYTDYLKKEKNIPWKLIGSFLLVLFFIGALAIFFYRLAIKLRSEIIYRKQVQLKLLENKKELIYSNEKLKMLSQFKEDLTHMIVHDMNSSLSIVTSVKQLTDEEGLNMVQQAGFKMLNLVQNILSVYKYENTNIELEVSEVGIKNNIEKAIEEVSFLVQQKALKIKVEVNSNCLVKADDNILRRIFVNLLSNAVKFSPNSGIIELKATVNNNIAKIVVINEGPTISIEKQKAIFERFGQADKRSSGGIKSTGLGLTFCKMAVEAHGGEIGVVSELNKPIEFWFTLPSATCLTETINKLENKIDYNTFLTEEEKDFLRPFIQELSRLSLFEITAINAILNDINIASDSVDIWKNELEIVVYSGNSEQYKNMTTLKY